MRSDRVKGNLDMLILAVLADGPAHGYAVITALRQRSEGALHLPEGSVYPALHRLEDRGLIVASWQTMDRRRRKVYRLTARGTAALSEQRKDWRNLVTAINAVLAQSPQPKGAMS